MGANPTFTANKTFRIKFKKFWPILLLSNILLHIYKLKKLFDILVIKVGLVTKKRITVRISS